MKNIETEFKFLIEKLPNGLDKPLEIIQIYFNGDKKLEELKKIFPDVDLSTIHTFRVRMITYNRNTSYVVTLKTQGGMSREEYEEEVSFKVATDLYINNSITEIKKNRYILKKDKYKFEFDEYLNLRLPLLTCEVEISNNDIEKQKQEIEEIFKGLGVVFTDVTTNPKYKNSNLQKYFG